MAEKPHTVPDITAIRVALWRALHVAIDAPPHILEDELGLQLAAPEAGWQKRPDMNPRGTARSRASIVARARYIEDLVQEELAQGLTQYVILGAGLDTFAQRHPELTKDLHIFEIDQVATQAWKKQRLQELGLPTPGTLHGVGVDFEAGDDWWEALIQSGFDPEKPAFVASTGVGMYLTRAANMNLLQELAERLAPGSTFAMSFMLPLELMEPAERPQLAMTMKYARAAGTPFLSLFTPRGILAMAIHAGFHEVQYIPASDLTELYFADRTDGLRPSSAEELIVARN